MFVDRELSRGLQEAESWTKDTFQTTVSEHLDLVRCVRASYHMACKKFAHLQKLPWLIVRIIELGVKKESLRQWSACAPHEHHRYTRYCLDPSQPVRSDIDDCSKAPPSLLAAVARLAALPMDDSIVEFPHAMASRLVKSGRATKFPFLPNSLRLKENLTTVRELGSAVSSELRLEWSSYTSLLQVHPKKCRRSVRISNEEFCSRLYWMGHFVRTGTLHTSFFSCTVRTLNDVHSHQGSRMCLCASPHTHGHPCCAVD